MDIPLELASRILLARSWLPFPVTAHAAAMLRLSFQYTLLAVYNALRQRFLGVDDSELAHTSHHTSEHHSRVDSWVGDQRGTEVISPIPTDAGTATLVDESYFPAIEEPPVPASKGFFITFHSGMSSSSSLSASSSSSSSGTSISVASSLSHKHIFNPLGITLPSRLPSPSIPCIPRSSLPPSPIAHPGIPPHVRLAYDSIISDYDSGRHWRVLGELGVGGNGRVVQALPLCPPGPPVAIKVIHKADCLEERDSLEDVYCEMVLLIRCSSESTNKFLPRLESCFEDEQRIYFVMPMHACTLTNVIGTHSEDVDDEAQRLLCAEMICAVEELHALRIVHRDIKPCNVMLTPTGHVSLVDLGLAVSFASSDPAQWVSEDEVGTPGYMAPESMRGMSHGWQMDIWGLGLAMLDLSYGYYMGMFQEMLYATYNRGPTVAELDHAVLWSPNLFLSIEGVADRNMSDLLHKMLSREQEERPTIDFIKAHSYFRGIDWNMIRDQRYTPHFIPPLPTPKPETVDTWNHRLKTPAKEHSLRDSEFEGRFRWTRVAG